MAELQLMDLSGACFDDAMMLRAYLAGSDLAGASFRRTKLAGAFFNRCDLRGATFEGADVSNATFEGSQLEGVDWKDAIGAGQP